MSVRVKICGVTRVEDAVAAAEAGADLLGLNFYAKSPRGVTLARALEIRRAVQGRVKLVGVFVNASRREIIEIADALKLDFVQLHGDEPEDHLAGAGLAVIRALRLKPGTSAEDFKKMLERTRADLVILDSYASSLYGGTGTALEPGALARFDLERAFVAGGLRPETVANAARLNPYGVDVASGVESAPGIKDYQKLRSFIANAKSAR